MFEPPRLLRTFDAGAQILFYENVAAPPAADGRQGDFAFCMFGGVLTVFGPKIDATTWPAGSITNGPQGAAGPGIAAWGAGTYATGQRVTFNSVDYVALANHIASAAFRTDLAAGKWGQVNSPDGGRMESVETAFLNSLAAWPLANRVYYYRVRSAGAISHVTLEIGTQSGNLVVGAYANNGLQGRAAAPAAGGLLATSGQVACPAVGVDQISLGSTIGVAAGDWLCCAFDNVTAKVRAFGSASGIGVTAGRYGYELLTAFPALPANPAPVYAATFSAWLAGEA